jgi:hypothetical protein
MKRLIYLKNGQSLNLIVSPLKNDRPNKKSSPIYLGSTKKSSTIYFGPKISFAIELTGYVELKNKEN